VQEKTKKGFKHLSTPLLTKEYSTKTESANQRAKTFPRFGMSRKAQEMSKKKVAYSSRTGDPT
jgi:hypothetical protein